VAPLTGKQHRAKAGQAAGHDKAHMDQEQHRHRGPGRPGQRFDHHAQAVVRDAAQRPVPIADHDGRAKHGNDDGRKGGKEAWRKLIGAGRHLDLRGDHPNERQARRDKGDQPDEEIETPGGVPMRPSGIAHSAVLS
jgi:hypothetical protein